MPQVAQVVKATTPYMDLRISALHPPTVPPPLASSLIVASRQTVAGTFFVDVSLLLALLRHARLGCLPGLLWNLPGYLSLHGNWLRTILTSWSSCMLIHTSTQLGHAIVSGRTSFRETGCSSRIPYSRGSQDFLKSSERLPLYCHIVTLRCDLLSIFPLWLSMKHHALIVMPS